MSAKRGIIPIFVPHLGCTNSCVFCNQRVIAGTLTAPSSADVRDMIEKGLEVSNILPEVAFYGGSFTAIDEERQTKLLSAAYEFIKAGKVSHIRISTRPDAIDNDILKRLSLYGVKVIELGAQSMDDKVLMLSKRGHTAKDTEAASQLIREQGFSLVLQAMCGLPGADALSDRETALKISVLAPDAVRIYPVAVIKDTELCSLFESGSYQPLNIEEAVSRSAEMLRIFEGCGIPVIRIGLNASDDLSGGGVVAGAYHPAFGELTRSRLYLQDAIKLISDNLPIVSATLLVHKSCISMMVGQKRCNIKALQKAFPGVSFKVKSGACELSEVRLLTT